MEKKDEEVRQEKMELQMIEKRLQSLIESYTIEIEDETKNLKKYKDELEDVLKESDCCVYTPVYILKLYPSSSKEKIVRLLEYFFKVCDIGASPQCTWKTDDCDYISLLLEYTQHDQIKFDLVRNKILEQFPELLMPENCLEKLPDYGKTEDYIASIEVAYPATWTVEYEMIDS